MLIRKKDNNIKNETIHDFIKQLIFEAKIKR